MFTLLIFAVVIFVGYAIYAYWHSTSGSIPNRVWGSVVAAAAAGGAAVQAWVAGLGNG